MRTVIARSLICVLTFLLTAIATATEQQPDFVLNGGLGVWVTEAPGEDSSGVRVTLKPHPEPSEATEAIKRGAVTVSTLRDGSGLQILGPDGKAWRSRLTKFQNDGRASVPGLEIAWQAQDDEALYGLGERFDAFNLNGRRVEMWIVDKPGQGDGAASYYVTPVLYSSAGYALLADDNPEGAFDLNSSGDGWHRYRRAGESASFVLLFDNSVPGLIEQRTRMIGGLVAPPAWSYRPWISKNSYETQAEAEAAVDGMRKRDLPFGVIVLEAWKGHSAAGRFNLFSLERWPEPEAFIKRCADDDVKVVLWQVPILHPSSPWFEKAKARGLLVRDSEGGVSLREEWLAGYGNIDFLNPEAVAFWKDLIRPVVKMGAVGFKADDGEAIKPDDRLGQGVPGWQAHNEYSTLYNRATYDVFAEEGVDGMIWARSGSLGIERSPALWAGDQGASWEQMRRLIPAGLSSSVSGMPYWGHDIGGYYGTCSPELYIRWLQFGAFSPYMQFHGIEAREPWHFGDEAVAAYRRLARLRMALLPTLIELGESAARTGAPIMRPMFYATGRHDGPAVPTQFLLGPDMLVAPVLEPGAAGRLVRFPAGRWLHATSPLVIQGPAELAVPLGLQDAPLFLREGTELRVSGKAGKRLDQWRKGDATYTMEVSPRALWGKSPVIENPRLPLLGHPDGGRTTLSFGVSGITPDRLRAAWWYEGEAKQSNTAVVSETPAGRVQIDLTPEEPSDAAGRRVVYRAWDTEAPTSALLSGAIDWDLLSVSIDDSYADVVTEGKAQVTGRVTNRSTVRCEAVLSLQLPNGVTAAVVERRVTLGPGETRDFTWSLEAAAWPKAIGDRRVVVEAGVGGVVWDQADAALIASPRWLVAGPFPAPSKTQAHARASAAEWSFSPTARFAAGDRQVRWEAVPAEHVAQMNGLDFNQLFGETQNAYAYATTVVQSDHAQDVQLRLGTDDTLSLWVNDELVFEGVYDRPALPDQNIVAAKLKQGKNRITVKVAQGGGGWGMVCRITDPQGRPVVGLSNALGNAAAFDPKREGEGVLIADRVPLNWRVLGPFDWDQNVGVSGVNAIEDAITDGRPLPAEAQQARWKPVTPEADTGIIDLAKAITDRPWVYAYAAAEFELDAPATVEFRGGSDDGLVLWVGKDRVINRDVLRAFVPGQDRKSVALEAGKHRVVARISQGQAGWGFGVDAIIRPER